MSRFYEIRPLEVANFLQTHKIYYREQNQNFVLKFCPLCPKPHNDDPTNMNTLSIKMPEGIFNCFRCGTHGNWFDFKNQVMLRFYGRSLSQMVNPASGGQES